jgi:2-polyprenyl-3-methyl-5-hydroxy-6-metoxy-1,4-benzoquinol methylase
LNQAPGNYRSAVYGAYLSSRGEVAAEIVAAQIRVRTKHCQRIIRDFFPPNRDARLLELASGYGALLHHAAGAGYREIRGVDKSPEQVEAAGRFGLANITDSDCNAFLESEASDSADAIISLDLIEHLSKPELGGLISEVVRVLKPGGRWIIHCPNGESPFGGRIRYGDFTHELSFTQRSLSQLLRTYGFARVICYEDGPVVHGVKSALRAGIWRVIRSGLRLWLAAETGQVDKNGIFTQNPFFIAYK